MSWVIRNFVPEFFKLPSEKSLKVWKNVNIHRPPRQPEIANQKSQVCIVKSNPLNICAPTILNQKLECKNLNNKCLGGTNLNGSTSNASTKHSGFNFYDTTTNFVTCGAGASSKLSILRTKQHSSASADREPKRAPTHQLSHNKKGKLNRIKSHNDFTTQNLHKFEEADSICSFSFTEDSLDSNKATYKSKARSNITKPSSTLTRKFSILTASNNSLDSTEALDISEESDKSIQLLEVGDLILMPSATKQNINSDLSSTASGSYHMKHIYSNLDSGVEYDSSIHSNTMKKIRNRTQASKYFQQNYDPQKKYEEHRLDRTKSYDVNLLHRNYEQLKQNETKNEDYYDYKRNYERHKPRPMSRRNLERQDLSRKTLSYDYSKSLADRGEVPENSKTHPTVANGGNFAACRPVLVSKNKKSKSQSTARNSSVDKKSPRPLENNSVRSQNSEQNTIPSLRTREILLSAHNKLQRHNTAVSDVSFSTINTEQIENFTKTLELQNPSPIRGTVVSYNGTTADISEQIFSTHTHNLSKISPKMRRSVKNSSQSQKSITRSSIENLFSAATGGMNKCKPSSTSSERMRYRDSNNESPKRYLKKTQSNRVSSEFYYDPASQHEYTSCSLGKNITKMRPNKHIDSLRRRNLNLASNFATNGSIKSSDLQSNTSGHYTLSDVSDLEEVTQATHPETSEITNTTMTNNTSVFEDISSTKNNIGSVISVIGSKEGRQIARKFRLKNKRLSRKIDEMIPQLPKQGGTGMMKWIGTNRKNYKSKESLDF